MVIRIIVGGAKMKPLRKRSSGISLAEYGLLGALITVVCYTGMHLVGVQINQIVIDSCTKLSNAIHNVAGLP